MLALGDLPHAVALGTIALCDTFVRATRADGDAMSVREALALGRPVVASDAAVRPGGVLVYPCEDPAALAEAIERSFEAPQPAPPADGLRWGRRVCAAAVERGVLIRPLGDVVVLMPPLTITSQEIHRIVDTLAASIDEVTGSAP